MKKESFSTSKGLTKPLGASLNEQSTNFSLYAPKALKVELVLRPPSRPECAQRFSLYKQGQYWSLEIQKNLKGYEYSYIVYPPKDLTAKDCFNSQVELLDPYACLLNTPYQWGTITPPYRGIILDHDFSWEGDAPLKIKRNELVIYEMHVRGFTQGCKELASAKGTFAAMKEKIPYLKKLGVTAVEWLPIYEFNERNHWLHNEGLWNFWGYSTINFFSPMKRYGDKDIIKEIKECIKAFHQSGIAVILDVVYNHTSEGNNKEYYESFRGIDNAEYYMLTEEGDYYNYSGCGNCLNANHTPSLELIRDSLHYWVKEFHIDGFRFDLASVLTRDSNGSPLDAPPVIQKINDDPLLKNRLLIAEAWDCGGLYQVGCFPLGENWCDWNGQFRDRLRQCISQKAPLEQLIEPLSGSPNFFSGKSLPELSTINFITAHDGFTLWDLNSFNQKHNEKNLEDNRDGDDHNHSWNCGFEGATESEEILLLREKQWRNYFTLLLFSLGIPMFLMGDEYGHSKNGNNNTWCHDNALNYLKWNLNDCEQSRFHFVQTLLALRKKWISPLLNLSNPHRLFSFHESPIKFFCLNGEKRLYFLCNFTESNLSLEYVEFARLKTLINTDNNDNSFKQSALPAELSSHSLIIAVEEKQLSQEKLAKEEEMVSSKESA